MNAPRPRDTPSSAVRSGAPVQPGVIGVALGAVLAAALAQGAWEWFSTYIGLTLLAVIIAFCPFPVWSRDRATVFWREAAALALIIGLSVAIMAAPALQRWSWLFPMPGTRHACVAVGALAAARVTGPQGAALAVARGMQRHIAFADCLATTTTRWLPVYGLGVALVVLVAARLPLRGRSS